MYNEWKRNTIVKESDIGIDNDESTAGLFRDLASRLSALLSAPVDAYAIRAPITPILTMHSGNVGVSVDTPLAFLLFNGLLGGRAEEAAPRRRPLTGIEERVLRDALQILFPVDASASEQHPHSGKTTILVSVMDVEGRLGIEGSPIALRKVMPTERDGQAAAACLHGALNRFDGEQLAALAAAEHPQTAAVLIGHAGSSSAGKALLSLSPVARAEVCAHLVQCGAVASMALDSLAAALTKDGQQKEADAGAMRPVETSRGRDALSRIFSSVVEGGKAEIMKSIREFRPDIATALGT
jgi:hypothetical protein